MGRLLPFLILADIALIAMALFDCVTTDPRRVRNLPKRAWVLVIILLSPVGGIAWFISGRTPDDEPMGRERPGRDSTDDLGLLAGDGFDAGGSDEDRDGSDRDGDDRRRRSDQGRRREERKAARQSADAHETILPPDDNPEFLRQLEIRVREARRLNKDKPPADE